MKYAKIVEINMIGVENLIYIITGCLSFIFLLMFDLNKIIFFNKKINILFPIGIFILGSSAIGILIGSFAEFDIFVYWRLFFGAVSVLTLLLLLYTLFIALPFNKTYKEVEKENAVIDAGMYALCRHPGVIWFFLLFVSLGMASAKVMMLWAALIWSVMNIIYVYVQDRFIFPKTLPGYSQYQKRVPFIIPSLISIKNCVSSLRW